jgi:lipoate-protein ligase A
MTDSWRFIDTGPSSASYNMALDEAIATAVRKNNAPPSLRIYGWDMPSVSIGSFQKISDVNIEYCEKNHIPIVRRPTGGRAILHNFELTYSFSVNTKHRLFSKGLFDSYKKISRALGNALLKIGLSPETRLRRKTPLSRSSLCFQSTSYGEITINNKKIIGSAQRRWMDGLLQQGSIPYWIDSNETVRVFGLESSHILQELMTGLKDIFPEFSPDAFKRIIRISFEETFNSWLIPSSPSIEEVSFAKELEAQKYLTHQWNFRR